MPGDKSEKMPEKESHKKERLFIGVPLDEETRRKIAVHLKQNYFIPGNNVPKENWHVTVFFIGSAHEKQKEQVCSLLDQMNLGAPFKITFGALLAFPSAQRTRIISLGLQGDFSLMSDFAERLGRGCEGLGFKREDRDYIPHMTLSRLKKHPLNTSKLLKKDQVFNLEMTVNRVVLYRSLSKGGQSIYEELKSWPFK